MAKKYHPDLNITQDQAQYDSFNQKFQQVNHAYQILSDATVKNRYDDLVGNFQAAEEKKETASSGLYDSLLRKKSTEQASNQ